MSNHIKVKVLNHGIFWGILLIVLAVGLVLANSGIIPATGYLVLMSVIFGAITIKSIVSLSFTATMFGIGHLLHLYRDYIGIPEKLQSWLLILAAVLVGIGLDIVFKNVRHSIKQKRTEKMFETRVYTSGDFEERDDDVIDGECRESGENASHVKNVFGNGEAGATMSGNVLHIENGFGNLTRYIDSNNFVDAHIENGFGNVTVYFDNVQMAGDSAALHVENGFGNINIYLPSAWGLNMKEENGLGKVSIFGHPNADATAKVLYIHAENGFGKINVYFN